MNALKVWFKDPRRRRQALTMFGGTLILLSLAVRQAFGLPLAADWMLLAAALAAGSDIAWRALLNLRNRAFSIDLLVSIAFIGALFIGEFWEAAAVTFLFIFGAYLEARTLSRTRQVLGQLLDLAPVTALVLRSGQQVQVAPHEVGVGERVLIKPGARVAVDGLVLEGFSAVDESAITGEPMPAEKSAGAAVYAGTVNQDGMLKVQATGVGADTTLARIIRRVEEAQEEKAPTQRFIERFARWYTPAIIVMSLAAFLITRNLELALTLLVIGCPGALVISTPVSIVAGIGRAAQKGILIKGGEYLENAGKISVMALDKTGTLTRGKPHLTDILVLSENAPDVAGLPADGWNEAQRRVLRLAGIAEVHSEHPLARPILAEAGRLETLPEPDSFEMTAGKGVTAVYQNQRIAVGTTDLMTDLGVTLPPGAQQQLDELKASGKTAVVVAIDQSSVGMLGIADTIRTDADAMVRELRKSGVHRVVMLTGDDHLTAKSIAAQAGIDEVHAGLLPEDKLDIVRRFRQNGEVVAMTGDGINDAPALAAADIGIAMGAAGTGIAIETADIALMSDDLMKIPQAIALSRAVLRNIRQNVVVALVTVAALLAGVWLDRVHMSGGMLIHQASVLLVIINGMRLLKA